MRFVFLIALVLLVVPGVVPAVEVFTLLDADFDDKTVDEAIGTTGPDAGEPIEVDSHLSAIVRDTPFATRSLEIARIIDESGSWVSFEFVGSASVDVGNVEMSVDVIFSTMEAYSIFDVREQGLWSSTFCKIYSTPDGLIRLTDAAGYYGVISTCVVDQLYNFRVVFDTEADSYDVFLDDILLVDDRVHGKVGVGIGRQAFNHAHSSALGSSFHIDNFLVTADEYTAAEGSTFSELKLLY
jgi:hypothetical protein